jgi:predicted P-loop ATPase
MNADPNERAFFVGRLDLNEDRTIKKVSAIDPATGADIDKPALTTFDDAKDAADAWGAQCPSPLVTYATFRMTTQAATPTIAPQPSSQGIPVSSPSSYEPAPMPFGVIRLGWMRTDVKGSPIPDEENVRLLLSNDPNLQGIAKYDEFAGDLILARPITSDATLVGERGTPRLWTDADTATLQTYIQQRHIPKIAREKIDSIVSMHAQQSYGFHPVREYLQSLSWDKTPRLDTWLPVYLGADSQPADYLAAVGPAWLISAVARIFKPGCQADCALVLEGIQGIRKSTALRVLSGDQYFSDSLPADLAHKDARDHLRGKWIIELSELAQFKRAEIETVKAFISRRYEQYRPSYGRHEVKFPRQCVFAGSTNDTEYLVDTTGNRRFWVVSCSRVDLAALTRDRDQLWAEAATRYRAGEPWHLVGVLEEMAAAQAAARIAHDPWTAKVLTIIAERITTADVSPGEIMEHMGLHEHERHARNAGRVGQILGKLEGWTKGRRHMTRGQLYVRPVCPPPPA